VSSLGTTLNRLGITGLLVTSVEYVHFYIIHSLLLPSLEAVAVMLAADAEVAIEVAVTVAVEAEEEEVVIVGSLFFSSLASLIFTKSPGISPNFPLSSPLSQP